VTPQAHGLVFAVLYKQREAIVEVSIACEREASDLFAGHVCSVCRVVEATLAFELLERLVGAALSHAVACLACERSLEEGGGIRRK
jgi:hypothetical protein